VKRAAEICAGLIAAAVLATALAARAPEPAKIQACFSPPLPGGCDPLTEVVHAIDGARKTILLQMYTLTSRRIVNALIDAKRRGVDVRAIVDRGQLKGARGEAYAVRHLASDGIPVLVDTVPGLMHDKVMIVDGASVVTGSFNYTRSAEERNAENLLVIHDPALAAQYTQNWYAGAARSLPFSASASGESTRRRSGFAAGAGPRGPVRGDRRTMTYQWPGCPYYDAISRRNRVEFPSAQEAKAAGYRPARNCH
jgi:phosphatidylserine/phosphatidylglycerophosphate/cardiolipin synthase-like enzyme